MVKIRGANEVIINAAPGENVQVSAGTMLAMGNHYCKTCEGPQIASPYAQAFAGQQKRCGGDTGGLAACGVFSSSHQRMTKEAGIPKQQPKKDKSSKD